MLLYILAIIGFLISAYTFFVEKKIKKDMSYKPFCDISDKISCTKPMTGAYGNMFFISNAVIGMAYYAFIMLAQVLDFQTLVFYASLAAALVSIYLAYILYVKIQSLCILCTSIYVINLLILIINIM